MELDNCIKALMVILDKIGKDPSNDNEYEDLSTVINDLKELWTKNTGTEWKD